MNKNKSKANIVANCILAAFSSLFCLALIFVIQRSSLHSALFNILSGCVFSAGIIFYAIAIFLRREWKFLIILLSVFLISFLYATELFFYHSGKSDSPQTNLADSRSKKEVINDLRKEGIDAAPFVYPHFFLEGNRLKTTKGFVTPFGGIANKKTVLCNESGKWETYMSDEYGFNNPKNAFKETDLDIVLVGDSFTHGVCVSEGEDIASLLRNRGYSTLNLGASGNGPLIEHAVIQEYARHWKPKIVLWMFYENDINDLIREKSSSLLLKYLNEDYSQNLLSQQSEIDSALTAYVSTEMQRIEQSSIRGTLLSLLKLDNIRLRINAVNPTAPPTFPPLFSVVMQKANEKVKGWGGELYFVYLPEWSRYKYNKDNDYKNKEDIISIIKNLNIPIIDFDDSISKMDNPVSIFPFELQGHYTAEGYNILATQITNSLNIKQD